METPDSVIDLVANQVLIGGRPVRLTPIEWQIIGVLVRHEGRLVTQRRLLHDVWGPQYESQTQYLRVRLLPASGGQAAAHAGRRGWLVGS